MTLGHGLLALVIVLAGYLAYAYNALVTSKKLTAAHWSGVDAQLRRRADLIPALAETVSKHAIPEDTLSRDLAGLRSQSMSSGGVAQQSAVGQATSVALGRLFAVAENDPGLKADANFRDLEAKFASAEDEIQIARRHYNSAVRNLNTRVESFPTSLIANFFRFRKAEFFEIGDAAAREIPKTGLKK